MKLIKVSVILIMVSLFLSAHTKPSDAAEQTNGQVVTKGTINFDSDVNTIYSEEHVKKKISNYLPKTGEGVMAYGGYLGIFIIMIALLLFLIKIKEEGHR